MKLLIDSYAWIEYLNATPKGKIARKSIDNEENELLTLDVCLAEIKFWALQQDFDFAKILQMIKSSSTIMETSSSDWLDAADVKFEKRKVHRNFGFVDALLLVYQQKLGAFILTGDSHFKGNKNIEFL